jgi:hypothetical protein
MRGASLPLSPFGLLLPRETPSSHPFSLLKGWLEGANTKAKEEEVINTSKII